MNLNNFSIEELANPLINKLDRSNIFPPLLNEPEFFLPRIEFTSFRKLKRCPNSFFICRSNVHKEASSKGNYNMRIISKATSILWKGASKEEKDIYKDLAILVSKIDNKRTPLIYDLTYNYNFHNNTNSNLMFPIHSSNTLYNNPIKNEDVAFYYITNQFSPAMIYYISDFLR